MNKQTENAEEERPKRIEEYFEKFKTHEPFYDKLPRATWWLSLSLFKATIDKQFSLDQKVGFEVNNQWYLYPEEAIHLFYKGKISICAQPEDAKTEEVQSKAQDANHGLIDNGLSLLKLVYDQKGSENMDLGMHIWRCYEFLRKNDFKVRRDSQPVDIDKLKGGIEEVVKKVKPNKEIVGREPFLLKPVFRVYDENQNYFNDKVSFYLLVMPLSERTFQIEILASIKESFKALDKLRLGLIDEEEVIIYDMKEI